MQEVENAGSRSRRVRTCKSVGESKEGGENTDEVKTRMAE